MQSDRLLLYIQQHFQRNHAVLTTGKITNCFCDTTTTRSYMSGEAWERMLPVIHETAYTNRYSIPAITQQARTTLGLGADLHRGTDGDASYD